MLLVNNEEAAEAPETNLRGTVRHEDLIGWHGSANESLKLFLVATVIAVGAHIASWMKSGN